MAATAGFTSALGIVPVSMAQAAPAAAVRSAAPAVAGVTWHKLTLGNGWVSQQGAWGSGDPAYAVQNGITYLSGSVGQASAGTSQFATLPPAARPSHALYITVYTFNGSNGVLRIYPDGQMFAYSYDFGTPHDAQLFTSLAAVSFPAKSVAPHPLALVSNWQSSQSSYNTGDPSYAISGGIAYLTGSAHRTSGTGTLFTKLPKADGHRT